MKERARERESKREREREKRGRGRGRESESGGRERGKRSDVLWGRRAAENCGAAGNRGEGSAGDRCHAQGRVYCNIGALAGAHTRDTPSAFEGETSPCNSQAPHCARRQSVPSQRRSPNLLRPCPRQALPSEFRPSPPDWSPSLHPCSRLRMSSCPPWPEDPGKSHDAPFCGWGARPCTHAPPVPLLAC